MKNLFIFSVVLILLTSCSTPLVSVKSARNFEHLSDANSIAHEHLNGSFTLLWYVNGSDLESGGGEGYGGAFTRNLQEVLSYLPCDDSFNVVIFSGGTERWETAGFEADINQVHFITKNGLEHGQQLPHGSIADPQTLAGFIDYAVNEFPADRYGLVFWDHGSSVPIGFGFDEIHEPKSINARDIAFGLKAGLGDTRLSFIGFDTCLMAAAETAALCAPYADYLIASEELEPNGGWNYAPLMHELVQNPSVDILKLCKTIANAFYDISLKRNPDDIITISVTDLSKIAPVVKATEKFALAAKNDLNAGGFSGISKGRAGTKYFGGTNESSDMVDLVHLAQRLKGKYPEESKELIDAVRGAVVHNRHSKTSPNSNGLSIYFPFENEAILDEYLDEYLNIGFTESYIELIRDFSARLKAGENESKNIPLSVKKLGERYRVRIPSGMRDNIVSVRAVLLGKENDNTYYIYSFIPDVVYKNLTVEVRLPREWLTMNGVPVCAQTENTPDGQTLYSIPVKINDRDMNIMLAREDSVFYLIGATPDGDEDSIPAPSFLPIVDGDTVMPKYPRIVITSDREEDGFYSGTPFAVDDGGLEIGLAALSEGENYFGFYLTDIYDNHFLSEIVAVNV